VIRENIWRNNFQSPSQVIFFGNKKKLWRNQQELHQPNRTRHKINYTCLLVIGLNT